MFDFAFSELVVIGVVALVVIGPERLPKVARTAGILLGRLQRYVSTVKADISREMELEELKKVKSEFQEAARDVEQSVHQQARAIEAEAQSVSKQLADTPEAKPATPEIKSADVTTPPPAPQMELGLDSHLSGNKKT